MASPAESRSQSMNRGKAVSCAKEMSYDSWYLVDNGTGFEARYYCATNATRNGFSVDICAMHCPVSFSVYFGRLVKSSKTEWEYFKSADTFYGTGFDVSESGFEYRF